MTQFPILRRCCFTPLYSLIVLTMDCAHKVPTPHLQRGMRASMWTVGKEAGCACRNLAPTAANVLRATLSQRRVYAKVWYSALHNCNYLNHLRNCVGLFSL